MKKQLVGLKRILFGTMALVMASTLVVPAPAMAAQAKPETGTEVSASGQAGSSNAAAAGNAAEAGSDNAAAAGSEASAQAGTEEITPALVTMQNRTLDRSGAKSVSAPVISEIDAPEAGKALDEKALVTTAENEKWEVPVLWISSGKEVSSGIARKDKTYLPVIAYIVPDKYTIPNQEQAQDQNQSQNQAQGKAQDQLQGSYTLTLSKEVTKLFGGSRIITIYEKGTGITYILPESLKDFFPRKRGESAPVHTDRADYYDEESGTVKTCTDNPEATGEYDWEAEEEPGEEPAEGEDTQAQLRHLIDVHCTQRVKELFSEDDLEFFVDLVINKLQPQAVNLLVESFPAFQKAVENGELGTEIGLVIDHDTDTSAVGMAQTGKLGTQNQYVYRVWINTNPVSKDLETSPGILREGNEVIDLANTMVHEFLHIFMHDYTRTGMSGTTAPDDPYYEEDGKTQTAAFKKTHFPKWFIEGTASAVEHNWRNRSSAFSFLRMNEDNTYLDSFERQTFLYRYVKGVELKSLDKPYSFDLACSEGFDPAGNPVESEASNYVTGYLATLYLCEMAAQKDPEVGTSIERNDGYLKIYSGNLKAGFNTILTRLHEGETLDQIICSISDGRYTSADDFEAKYVKGPLENDGYYYGDDPSLAFTLDVVNYMNAISNEQGRENPANGSVLFEFFEDFALPILLEPDQEVTTDTYKVIDSADYVLSTVSEDAAYATGGKSVSGKEAGSASVDGNSLSGGSTGGESVSGGSLGGASVSGSSASDGSEESLPAALDAAKAEKDLIVNEEASETDSETDFGAETPAEETSSPAGASEEPFADPEASETSAASEVKSEAADESGEEPASDAVSEEIPGEEPQA